MSVFHLHPFGLMIVLTRETLSNGTSIGRL